jgi:hypothetical protein
MALSAAEGAQKLYDLLLKGRPAAKLKPAPKPKPRGPARPVPIIGIATTEELRTEARLLKEQKDHIEKKIPRHSANYKGPKTVICPCGVSFEIPRHWPKDAKKYHSPECRKKYGHKGKWVFTPAMDAEIREAYAHQVSMDRTQTVKPLAEKLGVPRWKICRRAAVLGLVQTSLNHAKQNRPWTKAEKEITAKCAHLSPTRIGLKLKAAGFARSENSIRIYIQRHIGRKPRSHYSATSLANLLGIDSHAVMRWIRQGWLKAEHAGTKRTERQNGDSNVIQPEDVRQFIIDYVHLVDFRKVDKFWIVELLTGLTGLTGKG